MDPERVRRWAGLGSPLWPLATQGGTPARPGEEQGPPGRTRDRRPPPRARGRVRRGRLSRGRTSGSPLRPSLSGRRPRRPRAPRDPRRPVRSRRGPGSRGAARSGRLTCSAPPGTPPGPRVPRLYSERAGGRGTRYLCSNRDTSVETRSTKPPFPARLPDRGGHATPLPLPSLPDPTRKVGDLTGCHQGPHPPPSSRAGCAGGRGTRSRVAGGRALTLALALAWLVGVQTHHRRAHSSPAPWAREGRGGGRVCVS